jgi:hypothetical protein
MIGDFADHQISLGNLANQTLAQCGAACDRTLDCNQFDLSGSTQRPARTCYLYNAVVDGSQSQTDWQSAVLGTCAQYGEWYCCLLRRSS